MATAQPEERQEEELNLPEAETVGEISVSVHQPSENVSQKQTTPIYSANSHLETGCLPDIAPDRQQPPKVLEAAANGDRSGVLYVTQPTGNFSVVPLPAIPDELPNLSGLSCDNMVDRWSPRRTAEISIIIPEPASVGVRPVQQPSKSYKNEDARVSLGKGERVPPKEEFATERDTIVQARESAIICVFETVLSLILSFLPAEYRCLYYRDIQALEMQNDKSPKNERDQLMAVSNKMKTQLKSSMDQLLQVRPKPQGKPDIIIFSDASKEGWGAVCSNERIGGRWTEKESKTNISCREFLAAWYAVKSFCKDCANIHILIISDNTCPVSYINNMGGHKTQYDLLALSIWLWCLIRNIWLSAIHIPGKDNIADHASRYFIDTGEWKLDPSIFDKISDKFGKPGMDLFASRINKQLPRFASWKPDPEADIFDAFTFSWKNMYLYAFPPFCLMRRLVQKVQQDKAELLLVAPLWVTENWFTAVMEMLVDIPLKFQVEENSLTIPPTEKVHPLAGKLHLMVCHVSGDRIKAETFRNSLPKLPFPRRDNQLRGISPPTSTSGFHCVVKNRLIHFNPL